MTQLNQTRLRELFDYNQLTGEFVFRERAAHEFATPRAAAIFKTKCLGKTAGWRHAAGYVAIKIDAGTYLAHRLAWLWVTGDWPTEEIDHINGNRADNRLTNLRAVSKLENSHNQSLRVTNKSGATGVFFETRRQRWLATILNQGKATHLGYFQTFDEACAARKGAEKVLKFARGHGKARVDARYYKPKRLRLSGPPPDIKPVIDEPQNGAD